MIKQCDVIKYAFRQGSRVNSARNQYIPIDIIYMYGYYYSGNLTQTEITISDYKYYSNRN